MKIVTYPNSILRCHAVAVPEVGREEKKLMAGMLKHMRKWKGIGLAAPQVGSQQQIFVAEVEGVILAMANPVIMEQHGMGGMEEGCLSLPGTMVRVTRPVTFWIRALNEENERVELKLDGLLARVAQHEIDHLNGTLIIDHGPAIDQDMASRLNETL